MLNKFEGFFAQFEVFFAHFELLLLFLLVTAFKMGKKTLKFILSILTKKMRLSYA